MPPSTSTSTAGVIWRNTSTPSCVVHRKIGIRSSPEGMKGQSISRGKEVLKSCLKYIVLFSHEQNLHANISFTHVPHLPRINKQAALPFRPSMDNIFTVVRPSWMVKLWSNYGRTVRAAIEQERGWDYPITHSSRSEDSPCKIQL